MSWGLAAPSLSGSGVTHPSTHWSLTHLNRSSPIPGDSGVAVNKTDPSAACGEFPFCRTDRQINKSTKSQNPGC